MALGFKFQSFKLRVGKSGQRIYFRSEAVKDYPYLKGIALSIPYEGALYGSTFGFRVAEKEVLDESHEAHLLVFGQDNPTNERMLFFKKPIPINNSKLEGVYTDTALQGLLQNISNNPSGGIISKNDINISKTYVSGKDLMSYQVFSVDAGLVAYSSGISMLPTSSPSPSTPSSPSTPTELYYPYDVRVQLLLSQ
jgi:hypothetical protein